MLEAIRSTLQLTMATILFLVAVVALVLAQDVRAAIERRVLGVLLAFSSAGGAAALIRLVLH